MRYSAKIGIFFLFISSSFAGPLAGSSSGFDIKNANQQFDHINLQLSVQNLNVNNLDAAVNTLGDLSEKAEDCVDDIQKKLNNIDSLIRQGEGQNTNSTSDNKKEGADLIYLDKQRKELAEEQAQCRLFTIRAREAIEAYRSAIAELKQEEVLTRGLPLWSIFHKSVDAPSETAFLHLLTSELPAIFPSYISWLIATGFALLLSSMLLRRIYHSRKIRRYIHIKKMNVSSIFLLTAFFISVFLFIYMLVFYDKTDFTIPLMLSTVVFAFTSALVLLFFLFRTKAIKAIFYWYLLDVPFFQSAVMACLSFYTLSILGHVFSTVFNSDSVVWQLYKSLFLLTILAAIGYYIFYFCNQHRHITFVKKHHYFIKRFSVFILFTCALINVLGYYSLAKNLIISGFTTIAIIFITLLLTQGIKKLYLQLSQQAAIKSKIIRYFGYRSDQTFTEFLILKTVAQIIVVTISIYLIGESWGFATDYIDIIYDRFLNGVRLANITIYPTRLLSGIVVFCALYLIFRSISHAISSHQQFEEEEETQVAVASILTYIGFTLAVISGFLVAGFNFTGLAIIAGALSVGIGLGLQSIVNNFVSGLILLIEKPIRPGDRISVDGIEGFVKKIRVRSTQIITTGREDIIVPNSDLITLKVTNFMFSDKYCRIICEVGVGYGSDVNLVRDILLNLANEHDEVLKIGNRNKPVVLLTSFGENNLIFQLVFLIKDVNKKSIVHSEMNFAIEQAFRENNIFMANPQRDINIKLSDLKMLKQGFESE